MEDSPSDVAAVFKLGSEAGGVQKLKHVALLALQSSTDVADALRLGRMVALAKPAGGVRALVMGDIFRRLAQQFGEAFRTACTPFQYALHTRAGSEAVGDVVTWFRPCLEEILQRSFSTLSQSGA